jgi:hypothetical protein
MSDDSNVIYGELTRTCSALSAATKLHAAVIDGKADRRALAALVKDYYSGLCLKIIIAASSHHGLDQRTEEARIVLHDELVTNAGRPGRSAITRNSRYVVSLKDIIWPPSKSRVCFGWDGKLPKADLEKALKTLGGEQAQKTLREMPIPEFEAEREAMEAEVCAANRRRKALREIERQWTDELSQPVGRQPEGGSAEEADQEGQRQGQRPEGDSQKNKQGKPRNRYTSKWSEVRQQAVKLREQEDLPSKVIAQRLKQKFACKGTSFTQQITGEKVEQLLTYENRWRKQGNSQTPNETP